MTQQWRYVAATLAVMGGSAAAGDLTVPAAMPTVTPPPLTAQPAEMAAQSDWAGGYVGGQLGYGTANIVARDVLALQTAALGIDDTLFEPDGLLLGVRGGYDWQRGQIVFGVGGDYNLGDMEGGLTDSGTAATLSDPIATLSQNGRVFGRVGYQTGSLLPYALLGYATAKLEISGPSGGEGDIDGITAGFGAERKFMGNLSGYGEYSYTDFGNVAGADDQISVDQSEVRLGVNYRF